MVSWKWLEQNKWNGIKYVKTHGFQVFDAILSVPAIIMSRPPLGSLLRMCHLILKSNQIKSPQVFVNG
jgi:quinol-cytochrome oxidoreductase complex cytochrome b subunit